MLNWIKSLPSTEKHMLDVSSLSIGLGTMISLLPAIAAILTIIWTIIRIYETDTVQKLLGNKPIENKDE